MLLVVIGHAIQSLIRDDCYDNHLWNIIYSFHMPAFMALSGWLLFKGENMPLVAWGGYLSQVKRRFGQLIIPYILWSIIKITLAGNISINSLVDIILYPDKTFWFLWALFWIYLLFTILQQISSRIKISETALVVSFGFVLMIVMSLSEARLFGIQFITYYFLFYSLGYIIHRFDILHYINIIITTVLFFIWLFMAWYWNMHSLPCWMPKVPIIPISILQYIYRGLTAVFATLILLYISERWLDCKNSINNFVTWTGKVSLGIYVIHLILLGFVTEILLLLNFDVAANIVLSAVIAYLISIISVHLLMRNNVTAKYLLGKF